METKKYDNSETEACLKELRAIQKEYDGLGSSLNDILDSLITVWQGTGSIQLAAACESVREDSSRIRASIRSAVGLIERKTAANISNNCLGSANSSMPQNAVYHLNNPEGV